MVSVFDCNYWWAIGEEQMSAKNYNTGKYRPSLVLKDMAKAFESLLSVREKGAVKYDRLNFRESIGTDDAERFIDENLESLGRHFLKRLQGEIYDKETGEPHSAHIMCRAGFDVEYTEATPSSTESTADMSNIDNFDGGIINVDEGHIDRIPTMASVCSHNTVTHNGNCLDCLYELGMEK